MQKTSPEILLVYRLHTFLFLNSKNLCSEQNAFRKKSGINSINCAAPCLSCTLFSSRILLYKKQIVTADKNKFVQSGQICFLYRKLVQSGQVFCTQKKNSTVCILNYTDYEFCPIQLQLQFFCIFFFKKVNELKGCYPTN